MFFRSVLETSSAPAMIVEEDEAIERHPTKIVELLPSHVNGGVGADSHAKDMSEVITKIIFEGDESMQADMRNLCLKYGSRFAESVIQEAAHVPPMNGENRR